jgi:hypothetical protein
LDEFGGRSSKNSRVFFPRSKLCINFGKNGLGYILGNFFSDSSGHQTQTLTHCTTWNFYLVYVNFMHHFLEGRNLSHLLRSQVLCCCFLVLLLGPLFPLILFTSTTSLTGMTGIFLHGPTAPRQKQPLTFLAVFFV